MKTAERNASGKTSPQERQKDGEKPKEPQQPQRTKQERKGETNMAKGGTAKMLHVEH